MAYYKDLREYLEVLDKKGKLVRIEREINKDTELHPLVRLQFRGLPEEDRKAFVFDNIVDSKGRRYSIPVVICALAPSREVYSIGIACGQDRILEKWAEVHSHPIEPVITDYGPVHEEIHTGRTLLEHGGLEEFPIPISTPGFDAGPYFSAPYWVTKDPETGITNVGTYRAHVKSPTRTGVFAAGRYQHIQTHISKCRKMGIPLQAAIVIGGAPNIGYVATTKLPYEVSEFAYAGAIAGEPVELVRCRTVELEVPAHAEIVVEGTISIDQVEPEAPFGEALGYMGQRENMPYFTVSCITHRKNPIFQAFMAQLTPSEDGFLRGIGNEVAIYPYLKYECQQPWVLEVAHHHAYTGNYLVVIKVAATEQSNVWKTLNETSKWLDAHGITKLIVAVDEDIDARDTDALSWAISTRVLPHRDCRIDTGTAHSLMDYAILPPGEGTKRDIRYEGMPDTSRLLINATMKWPYTPVALPKREFMEKALKIWHEEKLPPLKLKQPWWGYNLGYWLPEEDEQAMMAIKGDYDLVGEMLSKKREKI